MGKLITGMFVVSAAFWLGVGALAFGADAARAELPAAVAPALPAVRAIEAEAALQYLWAAAVELAQADKLSAQDKTDLTKAASDIEAAVSAHDFDRADALLAQIATLLVDRGNVKTHA